MLNGTKPTPVGAWPMPNRGSVKKFDASLVELIDIDDHCRSYKDCSLVFWLQGQVLMLAVIERRLSNMNGGFESSSIEEVSGVFFKTAINNTARTCRLGSKRLAIQVHPVSLVTWLVNPADLAVVEENLRYSVNGKEVHRSVFSERTEEASATQYFQFYGYLSQQQNMLQDYMRTSTYQNAILQNIADFQDKVVLDCGAGTGILSYFAVQAGAKRVYAVEASNMANYAEVLSKANNLSDVVKIVKGKIEDITIPEKVDVIISEPMGYLLVNERMLETFLHSKKFLKAGGKLFPSVGKIYVSPFSDESLYMEYHGKASFWSQTAFFGVNLSSLHEEASLEYFRQPVVDTFDIRILMSRPITYTIDFSERTEEDLYRIHIPLSFTAISSGCIHGLAFWFEVGFLGSMTPVWLSTAPQEPLTHWYQVRCLLTYPLLVRAGQRLSGNVIMVANTRQSYDIQFELGLEGTTALQRGCIDLKNPCFRYSGVVPPITGAHTEPPTENYWNQAAQVQTHQQTDSYDDPTMAGYCTNTSPDRSCLAHAAHCHAMDGTGEPSHTPIEYGS